MVRSGLILMCLYAWAESSLLFSEVLGRGVSQASDFEQISSSTPRYRVWIDPHQIRVMSCDHHDFWILQNRGLLMQNDQGLEPISLGPYAPWIRALEQLLRQRRVLGPCRTRGFGRQCTFKHGMQKLSLEQSNLYRDRWIMHIQFDHQQERQLWWIKEDHSQTCQGGQNARYSSHA